MKMHTTPDTAPTNTSSPPSSLAPNQRAILWRVGRYLAVRGVFGAVRLTGWTVVQSFLMVRGLLGLMASPSSSGRSAGEFKDMYQADAPNAVQSGNTSDSFWRMYFQAYTPRAWRMRRLMPMVAD
ncbi:MAG: hypothetical protein EXR54_00615 [Dehalococcoidia bacterium]|nr:hypothetical protein [Dehalococcoidia bacterium]MSQ16063.1 hypothetical protein [Dehalococcoidia bacterium]